MLFPLEWAAEPPSAALTPTSTPCTGAAASAESSPGACRTFPERASAGSEPLYVLSSDSTFSAAEELTYDLQQLGRAVVVGERTRGGAHPCKGSPAPHRGTPPGVPDRAGPADSETPLATRPAPGPSPAHRTLRLSGRCEVPVDQPNPPHRASCQAPERPHRDFLDATAPHPGAALSSGPLTLTPVAPGKPGCSESPEQSAAVPAADPRGSCERFLGCRTGRGRFPHEQPGAVRVVRMLCWTRPCPAVVRRPPSAPTGPGPGCTAQGAVVAGVGEVGLSRKRITGEARRPDERVRMLSVVPTLLIGMGEPLCCSRPGGR
ncbi:S41 family peptidase [Streptomyces sp. NBC_01433]|uniref:S41 family peptidase n=1 Tax=Streptomyces sp. NBC_01433 TaxID=2903864 RepID=UPI002257D644|nr:S41 family peptidase [Streptomyces sp. NBC_01433]MCX4681930.1 S41 family peptidase [Streptomyces sp. NBC_01433]